MEERRREDRSALRYTRQLAVPTVEHLSMELGPRESQSAHKRHFQKASHYQSNSNPHSSHDRRARHLNESKPEGGLYGNPAHHCMVDLWPGRRLEGFWGLCYTPPCLAIAAPQASPNQFPWFHYSD
ncbi:unnamed protein product [Pleuronectes platessa]|uniref:Uncharacterized protein n=1 Tax=Pleuronectes platessa TaxID=8262 RepID=A0A9N7Z7P2_PLEPL|nr:unnamed protein product [Pleuronectes platessa]